MEIVEIIAVAVVVAGLVFLVVLAARWFRRRAPAKVDWERVTANPTCSPQDVAIIANNGTAEVLVTELANRGRKVRRYVEHKWAVEHLRRNPAASIILQVELPKFSGYSLCNVLRKDPILGHVPLVLFSTQTAAKTLRQHFRLA